MFLIVLGAILPLASCLGINHEHILGRDLAAAAPQLSALPADAAFAIAPLPGSVRTFSIAELKRIAAGQGIKLDSIQDVCFTWITRPLPPDTIMQAMRRALGTRPVQIEILSQSAWPAPEGDVTFPLSGISLSTGGIALWRGFVAFGASRRFDVWARARLTVQEQHVLTAENVAAGERLRPVQLKTELYAGPFTTEEPLSSIDQASEFLSKFDLPAGTLLTHRLLTVPHDIERGDTLSVVSVSGHARVEVDCVAEENGRIGSVISVRNARSGRRFRALLQAKGKGIVADTDALGLLAVNTNRP